MFKSFLLKVKSFMPDSLLIWCQYAKFNRRIYSSSNISSFSNSVFSWKLNTDLTSFSQFVDKYTVRNYVAQCVGDKYLVKLLKVVHSPEDFHMDEMPDKFVIKLNNGCGYNLVVTDKSRFTNEEIRALIADWLISDFYRVNRESQYKGINQLVLCEEYLEAPAGLKDYKFYCIEGKVEFIQVISERKKGIQRHNYYSSEWMPLEVHRDEYEPGELEPIPLNLGEAISVVEKLASKFNFVRVDLYLCPEIYFGELTFTPGNGLICFKPKSFDLSLAKKLCTDLKINEV